MTDLDNVLLLIMRREGPDSFLQRKPSLGTVILIMQFLVLMSPRPMARSWCYNLPCKIMSCYPKLCFLQVWCTLCVQNSAVLIAFILQVSQN